MLRIVSYGLESLKSCLGSVHSEFSSFHIESKIKMLKILSNFLAIKEVIITKYFENQAFVALSELHRYRQTSFCP